MSKEQDELVAKVEVLMEKKYGDTGPESLRKLFDAYDKDRDGMIDATELEALLKDAGVGNSLSRGMWVKGILAAMDENGDKKIDWPEFTKAVA